MGLESRKQRVLGMYSTAFADVRVVYPSTFRHTAFEISRRLWQNGDYDKVERIGWAL